MKKRAWIKREALQDARLADFLALAMEDAARARDLQAEADSLRSACWQQRRIIDDERAMLRQAFAAADKHKLGADFCNATLRLEPPPLILEAKP